MNIHSIEILPINFTSAYLAGAIVGDGHITKGFKTKNSCYNRATIQIVDKSYAEMLLKMFKELVPTKTTVKVRYRTGHKPLYSVTINNKSLFHFLVFDLKIPMGAKSRIVCIPERIKCASDEVKVAFLAGIFDTDGGKRGKTIGLTSASLQLICDVQDFLLHFDILSSFEVWRNKKYDCFYYGLKIKRGSIDTFLRSVPVQDIEKFLPFAAVPERPNGPENAVKAFGQA